MHLCTEREYNILAKRNERLKNIEGVFDPRIQSLCEVLNSVGGIQTVWSCSGHTPEEREGNKNFTRDGWYVSFVVNQQGFEHLGKITKTFKILDKQQFLDIRPGLTAGRLMGTSFFGPNTIYNTWKLAGLLRYKEGAQETLTSFWDEIIDNLKGT